MEGTFQTVCCAVLLVAQVFPTLCDPMDCRLPGSVCGDSPGKKTGVGCHAFLQRIFSTQGSNLGLLHCTWILYHLSHQEGPRTLEQVAYPFSRETSQPRNLAGVSCIADGSFTSRATWEAFQTTYRRLKHCRVRCVSSRS